ncbi:MAG: HAD family phosphatase [Bacteroidales bacterium]|nr:HAD family phosphatase [Bacteroidales bacterium]
MIKNIVFDLGGVLVPLNRRACEDAFHAIGFDDFGKILNEYVQGGFFLEYEKGAITTSEFRDILRSYIENEVTNDQIDFAMGSFLEVISDDKLEFLISLKKKFRLYMLSNTNEIAMRVVRPFFNKGNLTINDYFDKLFLSYEMKMAKPDSDIFIKMANDASFEASETLFIDDSPANIQTAQCLGFHTLLFNHDMNLKTEVEKLI